MTLFIREVSKNKSKILLVLILIAFTPLFLSYNIAIADNNEWLLFILPFSSLSLIIIGPLLYEYSFQFFNANSKKLFEHRKKYIPFFVCMSLLFSAYIFLSHSVYTYILLVTVGISFIHLVFYIVKLIRYQTKSTKKLKLFYSKISDKNLFWVNILIIGLFIVVVLDSISGVIIASSGFKGIFIINTIFLLALIWYLGYYNLTLEKITQNIHELKIPTKDGIENNLCSTKEFKQLKIDLSIAMEEKQLYKLEQVNLSILSEHLGITVKKTSYLLNHCMNTTFYDLINDYRLAEFKSKIEKGELMEKTILGLAFESGFNSKATFNRIFKQKELISPMQFVKNQKKIISK